MLFSPAFACNNRLLCCGALADQRPFVGRVGVEKRAGRQTTGVGPDGKPCRGRILQEQAFPGAVGLQVGRGVILGVFRQHEAAEIAT